MSEKSKTIISKQNINRLKEIRQPDDIDMVAIVAMFLKDFVSKKAEQNFLNNINIMLVSSATPGVQRVAINRYFTTKLLVFRATSGIPVMDQLLFLVNDGDTKEWFELFKNFIIPFLKKHRIE